MPWIEVITQAKLPRSPPALTRPLALLRRLSKTAGLKTEDLDSH